MKPLMVSGSSIAETWEKALLALYEEGVEIATQYDVDPNTGHKHPPSKDCSMVMHVEDAIAEPRLHVCLQGGVDDLVEYEMEVVEGVKDHWVKKTPEETFWTYTYHGRLAKYGDRMNFAGGSPGLGSTKLGYSNGVIPSQCPECYTSLGGYPVVEEIPPFDQIQHIIDSLAEAPYTRRAIAVTSFPPADAPTDDPPCLREVWCRGYYRDGVLKIDMQTYWRSRDAWGAALYNMYGLTELQRYIVDGVRRKLNQMHPYKEEWMTDKGECPVCGGKFYPYSGPNKRARDFVPPRGEVPAMFAEEEELTTPMFELRYLGNTADCLICGNCGLRPYAVQVGSYTDYASSFHIYGKDLPAFEDQMLSAVKNRTPEQRMWNVGEMLAGGEKERVRKAVMEKIARRDAEREAK